MSGFQCKGIDFYLLPFSFPIVSFLLVLILIEILLLRLWNQEVSIYGAFLFFLGINVGADEALTDGGGWVKGDHWFGEGVFKIDKNLFVLLFAEGEGNFMILRELYLTVWGHYFEERILI
jgi:hypothetical protein